ncbi:unnamed protein product [Rotaria sp. Silwood1]|nr:unnamed protein product [Rotaria sp. Silwood1]CAF3686557.1 unnamed protein product [Rotaria sp. Silwood1]CAF3691206.1 unnamed protein product [Rotaria sp. Silwood1]CAF3724034.1 unnamed protein product [Rotaria sp. Silwood1]CAF4702289.1 unnamed protein product [Rotaria sp. Silwood1]
MLDGRAIALPLLESVYVSDTDNNRVIKWLEATTEGILVAGGQGSGNDITQLSHPLGVVVDALGTVYIADCINNRVMRWINGASRGDIIAGANVEGTEANQFHYPIGLSFD